MKNKLLKGSLCLLITDMIWGVAFVAQDVAMDSVGPLTSISLRDFIASAILVPLFLLFDCRKKKEGTYVAPTKESRKKLWRAGILCGICLAAASFLQQAGIAAGVSSGKAGFLTALYILFVPIFGVFFGKKPSLRIWFCVVGALVGVFFLCTGGGNGFSFAVGDLLVIGCSLLFTCHILCVDALVGDLDPIRVSSIQFLVGGILTFLPMLLIERPTVGAILSGWAPILYLAVGSSGIAYTLQIVGQKYTPATVASLLMSLESFFAAVAGALILHQMLSPRELVGCGLMLCAILVSELPERSRRK